MTIILSFLTFFVVCLSSSSTPESLGLKHLAVRPKKQQLIEDQRQKIAKENAKLMNGMTKVSMTASGFY